MITFDDLKADKLAADVAAAQEALYPQFCNLVTRLIVHRQARGIGGINECGSVFLEEPMLFGVTVPQDFFGDITEQGFLYLSVEKYWNIWAQKIAAELCERGFLARTCGGGEYPDFLHLQCFWGSEEVEFIRRKGWPKAKPDDGRDPFV